METKTKTAERVEAMVRSAIARNVAKSKKDVAEKVGISPQLLSRYLAAKTTPTPQMLNRIAEAAGGGFDDNWVQYGIGEMFATAPVINNSGKIGDNLTQQGMPPQTIDTLVGEMREQREMYDRHVQRLLTIIEKMQA